MSDMKHATDPALDNLNIPFRDRKVSEMRYLKSLDAVELRDLPELLLESRDFWNLEVD